MRRGAGGGQRPRDSSVSICMSSPSASAHSRPASVTIIFAAERGSVVLRRPQILAHGGQSI